MIWKALSSFHFTTQEGHNEILHEVEDAFEMAESKGHIHHCANVTPDPVVSFAVARTFYLSAQ